MSRTKRLRSAVSLFLRGYRPFNGGLIHRTVRRIGAVEFGRGVRVHQGVVLDAGFGGVIRIGDGVGLCMGVQLATAGGNIELGAGSFANSYCVILAAGNVCIGRDVMLGPRVTIAAGSHKFDGREPIRNQSITGSGVNIGDNAWICASVTIIDGVSIGEGAVVAAGAVVTQDTPAFAVVAGVPAKLVRYRDANEAVEPVSVVP